MSKQPRWSQTWLSGPRATGVDLGYPGERLGFPKDGPGSVSRFGRRFGAILVDWLVCTWAIGRGLLHADPRGASWVGLGVFALEYVLLAGTIGTTLGMKLFGIRVAALGGGRAPVGAVVLRTLLLCLALPALVWDRDQRGLHDRAAGTVVLRA